MHEENLLKGIEEAKKAADETQRRMVALMDEIVIQHSVVVAKARLGALGAVVTAACEEVETEIEVSKGLRSLNEHAAARSRLVEALDNLDRIEALLKKKMQ